MKLQKHLCSCLSLLVLMFGCSKADPVASDYKQKLAQGDAKRHGGEQMTTTQTLGAERW